MFEVGLHFERPDVCPLAETGDVTLGSARIRGRLEASAR
jgi:hypothetical protein